MAVIEVVMRNEPDANMKVLTTFTTLMTPRADQRFSGVLLHKRTERWPMGWFPGYESNRGLP